MSAETDKTLIDAVHAITPQASMVTGVVLMSTYLDDDGDPCWGMVRLDDQGVILTAGLVSMAQRVVDIEARNAMADEDGDV